MARSIENCHGYRPENSLQHKNELSAVNFGRHFYKIYGGVYIYKTVSTVNRLHSK